MEENKIDWKNSKFLEGLKGYNYNPNIAKLMEPMTSTTTDNKTDLSQMKEMREKTIKKWKDSGLLDGLTGECKPNIALLLEGASKQEIKEYTNNENFVGFPIVRRVLNSLPEGMDIVGIHKTIITNKKTDFSQKKEMGAGILDGLEGYEKDENLIPPFMKSETLNVNKKTEE